MNYFVRYLNIKEIITESQKYTDVFKSVFKYSHTYKHANTYIRKHIRVGQNRSSIKNEFRFPCCSYCCFATVFDFAVTIFYKHSFLFQYPLSHLVLSFSEAILQKAKLSSFGAVFKVFDMVHLKVRYVFARICTSKSCNWEKKTSKPKSLLQNVNI